MNYSLILWLLPWHTPQVELPFPVPAGEEQKVLRALEKDRQEQDKKKEKKPCK